MGFSKIFKNHFSRSWFIVSLSLAVVAGAVSIAATNEQLSGVIDTVLGGRRPIIGEGGIETGYNPDFPSKKEAKENGDKVNIRLCEEGTVLLKNDNEALPLEKGSKISVFGKNSVNLITSGSGSASDGGEVAAKTIFDSLEAEGFSFNQTLRDFYLSSASGSGRSTNPKMSAEDVDTPLSTGETPQDAYPDNVKDSYADYSDAAVIVLSRIAGEEVDLFRKQPNDATRHFLQLDANEEALIDAVVNSGTFKHVILLLNAANPLELGFLVDNAKIDAALQIGFPGEQGIMAFGRILSGKVNPSGHLVDTYPRDFASNPVYHNFSNNGVADGDRFVYQGTPKQYYFVDYEEGIYVGYRYYESKYASLGDGGDAWYSQHVAYPFGHGLSYTSFDWNVKNASSLASFSADSPFVVEVEVENTGKREGKEVVELYVEAPYASGGIEKSAKVLAGFAKTDLLPPKAKQTLKIAVDPYDFASFDAEDANGNGFKGYELEKGDYTIHVARNAHDSEAKIIANLSADHRFERDPITGNKAEVLYEDADDHLQSILSRADFEASFPKAPTDEDRILGEEMYKAIRDVKPYGNPILEQEVAMPVQGKDYGEKAIKIQDLFGKAFDDPKWEQLLNQISIAEMRKQFEYAAFTLYGMVSIGLNDAIAADGPVGFTNFMSATDIITETVQYCSECVSAATWNVKLLEEMGKAVGNESLVGTPNGGQPYTGWNAPGLNLHRSPFGGRNCEYFSEDPFLSGVMGASEIKGAQSKGVLVFAKHFVGNEQETHRSRNGDMTFLNEQSLRELYLKPFEFSVKDGKAKGIMTSFNRLGTRWTGGDYRLLTQILRKEWGFHGAVISDFNVSPTYMNTRQMAYAGGTLDLATQPHHWVDESNPRDIAVLREAIHENLYALGNSNVVAQNIVGYKMAYWKIGLIVADSVILGGILIWGVFALRIAFKKKD